MSLRIVEFFGYAPDDKSEEARKARSERLCPFLGSRCIKTLNDKSISGTCTVRQAAGAPIVVCPIRLYEKEYSILQRVADLAFEPGLRLVPAGEIRGGEHGRAVAVFGKRWGKELKLPKLGGKGGYFVDWVLALISGGGELEEFVAVEVQTMDTTGTYREQRDAYLAEQPFEGGSKAGINWQNVYKRIIPQLIYKGHVLQHEEYCRKGLFFVTPGPVYEAMCDRLGQRMQEFRTFQPGSLTFQWYNLGEPVPEGQRRELVFGGQFITTVTHLAWLFVTPTNLPPANCYEQAIRRAVGRGA